MLNIFSCAYLPFICFLKNFPGSSVVKNPPANAGDARSIPWSGRSPGEGNGNPLQYACLGNPVDRGAWLGCSPWDSKESDMTQQLNNNGKLSCVKCLFRSLPIFFLLGCFLISEFWEFFVFSRYTFFRKWYSASNSSRLCLSFRAVSFTCQKLHILMISNLSFLHVIFKFLPNLRLQWFSLVFSSRSIIVLTLTFRPTIQLELIFLVKVHILSMNVQSVQCHSLKRFILCPWNCLCTFIKIKWLHVCWYISRQFIFFQSYEF